MGIDDIIKNEPMYAGEYANAVEDRQRRERLRARTENGSINAAATDGGAQMAETTLSLGGNQLQFSQTETLMLGLLLVNTAMTAGLLFAVLME